MLLTSTDIKHSDALGAYIELHGLSLDEILVSIVAEASIEDDGAHDRFSIEASVLSGNQLARAFGANWRAVVERMYTLALSLPSLYDSICRLSDDDIERLDKVSQRAKQSVIERYSENLVYRVQHLSENGGAEVFGRAPQSDRHARAVSLALTAALLIDIANESASRYGSEHRFVLGLVTPASAVRTRCVVPRKLRLTVAGL